MDPTGAIDGSFRPVCFILLQETLKSLLKSTVISRVILSANKRHKALVLAMIIVLVIFKMHTR